MNGLATRVHPTLSLIVVATLALNVLPQAAHSQSTPATTTPEATTTAPAPAAQADWFKVERLTGDVAVGDFVIGPGKVEVELQPGQSVIREISVSNRVSDDRRFDLAVEDIAGTEDGSEAVILLGDDRGPYSLRDFISFPEDSFEIGLGERARIPVTISIPPDAEPGGYYGAVLVSTVRTDPGAQVENQTAPRSPIIARVGTLFFVTVPGDVEVSGAVTDLTTTGDGLWYESGPIGFGITYENTGSKHLGPYGELRIRNLLGEEVGVVELDPWFVLPQSVRFREVTFDRELLLGRYTATAYINRGYDDIIDERTVTFWVLPWKVVLGVFASLFILFLALRAFFRTFELKRKS